MSANKNTYQLADAIETIGPGRKAYLLYDLDSDGAEGDRIFYGSDGSMVPINKPLFDMLRADPDKAPENRAELMQQLYAHRYGKGYYTDEAQDMAPDGTLGPVYTSLVGVVGTETQPDNQWTSVIKEPRDAQASVEELDKLFNAMHEMLAQNYNGQNENWIMPIPRQIADSIKLNDIFGSNDFGALRSILADGLALKTQHLAHIKPTTTPAFLAFFFDNFANDQQRKLGLQNGIRHCIGDSDAKGHPNNKLKTDNAACLEYFLIELASAGLDIEKTNFSKERLLLTAVQVNALNCVQLLIDWGADPTGYTYERLIRASIRNDNADVFRHFYNEDRQFIGIGNIITRNNPAPNAVQAWCEIMRSRCPDAAARHIEGWFFLRNPVKYLNMAQTDSRWFIVLKCFADMMQPEKMKERDPRDRSGKRSRAQAVYSFRRALEKIAGQYPADVFEAVAQ